MGHIYRERFLPVLCAVVLAGFIAPLEVQAVDKSGVQPTTISLPSGPGSIEGLGSDFEPNLNTGTSSYDVPIALPNGTAGNAPGISLNYEGGNGNSAMGIAWSLSMSAIRRQCDKGIPRYEPNGVDDDFDGMTDESDEEDRFLDPSGEELVLLDNGIYYPENQEQFIRWRHITGEGQDHWEGHLPNGVIREFGLTEQSRVQEGDRVYKWYVERITDTKGNVVEYEYAEFPGSDNRVYCSVIRYGPGAPPWDAYYVVAFTYEDRADVLDDYRSGFLIRTGKRLKQIDIALQGDLPEGHLVGDVDADGNQDALIRRYILDYETHPHWSLLSRVTLFGADGASSLPPAEFEYGVQEQPRVASAATAIITGQNEPNQVVDNDFVEFIDLNADGLPDMLRTQLAGSHTAYLNEGVQTSAGEESIVWGNVQDVDATDSGGLAWQRDLSNDEVSLMDLDGDGLADLVFNPAQDPNPRYYRNRGDLSWGEQELMTVGTNIPPAPYGDPAVRTMDLDFDKNIDIVRPTATGFQVWYALGRRLSDDMRRYSERVLSPGAFHEGSALVFADELGAPVPGTTLADVNGDRVTDVARIRPTSVIVAHSLGYGNFTESLVMAIPPDNGFGHDSGFSALTNDHVGNAELIDITGNGLADLIVREAGFRELWYWINLGNGTFDQRRIVNDLPSNFSAQNADVRWADLNGNGTDDLVYADSGLASGQKLRAIDIGVLINGNACPFLMSALTNGIGMRTEIQYRPSTAFAADDLRDGNPWTSPLPNPTILVARMTVFDGLGNDYVSEFRFHNGFYHGAEKEFRGFAEAEKSEIGDPSQPTLVTEYEYDVGFEIEALKGKTLSIVERTLQGQVFSEIRNTWTTRRLFTVSPTPVDRLAPLGVTYPYLEGAIEHLREEPGGATQAVTLESAFKFDDYGNQVIAANYGRISGSERNFGEDERISWTVYSATPQAPIWSAAVETVQTDNSQPPRLISHSQAFYDGSAFVGLPLGSVPIGNQTRSRDWVGPHNPISPPNPLPDPSPRFVNVTENPDNTLALSIVDDQDQVVGPDEDHWIETSRNRFDSFGNIVCTADPLASIQNGVADPGVGHFQEVTYDNLLFTYPVMEDVFTGQTTLTFHVGYDLAFGLITGSTDLNNHHSSYGYDALARMVRIVKPGGTPPDTSETPSYTFEYVLRESVPISGGTGSVNWVESRTHEEYGDPNAYFTSRKYFDGLARTVLIKEEDELASRSVVKEAYLFNERKQPRRILLPFYGEAGLSFEDIRDSAWTGTWVVDGVDRVYGLAEAPAREMVYDETGRRIQNIQPDGSFSRTTYLPLVNRIEDENDTDPTSKYFGTPKTTISDGLGRMIAVEEKVRLNDDGTPRGDLTAWRTSYTYDLLDDLIEIVDSQNNRKILKYDAIKRLTYLDDPNRGRMWYEYDDASNQLRSVDAKGQLITNSFDGRNRILTEDYHDEGEPFSFDRIYDPLLPIDGSNQPDVAFYYDVPVGPIDLGNGQTGTAANTRGFLSYIVDLSGEEHTSYDERGRIAWDLKRIPDPENDVLVSYKTEIVYDAMDRIVAHECPDGDKIGYEYNDRTSLENITGGETANRDGNPFILSGIDYIPSGQKREMTYGNGVASSLSYDRRLRMKEVETARGFEPDNPILHYGYNFDAVSNVDRIEDLRTGVGRGLGDSRRNTQIFEYDDLYRLTRVQYSFALPGQLDRNDGTIDYRYDRIGNMLFKSSPFGDGHIDPEIGKKSVVNLGEMAYGGALGASNRNGRSPADPPGPHALTSTLQDGTYSYDGNGNMDNLDGLECAWDFKDRLVSVENEEHYAEYTYDYSDRRVIKKVWKKDAEGQIEETDLKSTLYVTPNYEVREYDRPVKYVWDGESRVARITGTLDPDAQRSQQLRVHEGWNVFSLAIETPDAAQQIAQQMNAAEIIAYRWEETTDEYISIRISDELHAGDVFWVRGAEPNVLKIVGTYSDPVDQSVEAGNRWVASTGLESVAVDRFLPPIAKMAWFYDAWNHRWRSRFTGEFAMFSVDPPAFVRPGLPVFVESDENLVASTADSGSRIHYYHPDHISSANIVTDAEGKVVEESVFYPFGQPRERQTPDFGGGASSSNYLFTQKELDKESGLQYFESRYLSGALARFNRTDPLIAISAVGTLANPQGLNLYAYAGNNPLAYTDPGGEIFATAVGAVLGGLVGGIVGAVKAKKGERWKGFAKGAAKGAAYGALGGLVIDAIAITIVSCGAATPVAAGAGGILLAAAALSPGAIIGASAAGGAVSGATAGGVEYATAHGGEGQPEFSGGGMAASIGMGAAIGGASGGLGGYVGWSLTTAITPAAASAGTLAVTNAVGAAYAAPTVETVNQGGGYIQSRIIGSSRSSFSDSMMDPPSAPSSPRSSFWSSNPSFSAGSRDSLDLFSMLRAADPGSRRSSVSSSSSSYSSSTTSTISSTLSESSGIED